MVKNLKPVILITLYRRYYELSKNLEQIHKLKKEFRIEPDIVLVWSNPEIGRLWQIQEWLDKKLINYVVNRPRLEGEIYGGATSIPESINLRKGLEFIKSNYESSEHYIIGQAADIYPHEGTYSFVDNKIHEGNKAILFHLENGIIRDDIWHTNFFVVPIDEKYWPPLSPLIHSDILERQWGLLLSKIKPDSIFKWHNSGEKRFKHQHLSDNILWPIKPQNGNMCISCYIKGKRNYKRIIAGVFNFIKRRLKWQK